MVSSEPFDPWCCAISIGDRVEIDLSETVVLRTQYRRAEVVKLRLSPIVRVLDPVQGAYCRLHRIMAGPHGEHITAGCEVLIAKLGTNSDQESSNRHNKVFEVRPFKLLVAVMLARVVGLIPGEADAPRVRLARAAFHGSNGLRIGGTPFQIGSITS